MKILVSLIIVAALIGGAFIFKGSSKKEAESNSVSKSQETGIVILKTAPFVGNLAPDFRLKDLGDKEIFLSDFKNKKPVFLNFWAGWCPFCLSEMLNMKKIKKEFGDKIEILAVNRGESKEEALKFAEELGIKDSYPLLLDPDDRIYFLYRGFAMPLSFFIDKQGIIRDQKLGEASLEEMREKINKVLQYN